MPVIYRVENTYGHGPYIGPEAGPDTRTPELREMEYAHSTREAHRRTRPTPVKDGISGNFERDGYVCGFADRRSAFVWFAGWRDVLGEAGFGLVRYHVPILRVRFGRRQVAFSPVHARRLGPA